jgi:hypothetical protein
MVKARGGRFRPVAGAVARWLGALRHRLPSLSLIILLAVAALPLRAPAAAPFALEHKVDFGGGAIIDFASSGPGSALVIGAMPEGFSVFAVDFVSGGITKFVSHTYLEGAVPAGLRADALSLEFEPQSGLLLLLPRTGQADPVLLDVSQAPKLKRYRLGLPDAYDVGGAAFCGDSVIFYPALVSLQEGRSRLLRLSRDSGRLEELVPGRRFAIVREVVSCPAEGKLLALGFFTASAKLGAMELAYISLSTGAVEILPQAGGILLASAAGKDLVAVRENRATVAAGDARRPGYRLEAYELNGLTLAETGGIPLYSRPEKLLMLAGGKYALLVSAGSSGRRDLWLMDLAHRSKHLVLKGVVEIAAETAGGGFIVQPADQNALMYYTVSGAGK